ncbi:Acetylcholine receptor subunit beta-type unc-29 [Trichinella britovi]|uniref:Acetylcholine receptor subunit beta-type unc-29 n=1 Tax=Trichinella britovi TaxID=45882 RepID=A0A0V1CW34_TRIBR|nr:Acetylcholine receptor subunit beta-type unc-29 [Trichinella britovi]
MPSAYYLQCLLLLWLFLKHLSRFIVHFCFTSVYNNNNNNFSKDLCAYDEDLIYSDIFHGYNPLVLPIASENESRVVIEFGMSMILLVNVDEKNQILQTNVWLTMSWKDPYLRWNPADYNMIKDIRVPVKHIWVPDVVLFNNADGHYEVSFFSNVMVESDGTILWVPPAIYKSSCTIDVENFPFDEQTCLLVFGSWTYTHQEVHLTFYRNKKFIELQDYSYSGVWDIIDVPGIVHDSGSKLTFCIKIKRKPLFYTVLFGIPTMMMAYLSVFVFYLPAGASEKITLSINLLLALVVFMLLISKILPSNSNTLPLIAKYLLLTFILDIMAIIMTVIILNIYFRRPGCSRLPHWARSLFLVYLPRVLLMKRPSTQRNSVVEYVGKKCDNQICLINELSKRVSPKEALPNESNQSVNDDLKQMFNNTADVEITLPELLDQPGNLQDSIFNLNTVNFQMLNQVLISTDQIFDHFRRVRSTEAVREEWRFVSLVLDRLLLYVFFGITLGGTAHIFFQIPNLFLRVDQREIIERIYAQYATQEDFADDQFFLEKLILLLATNIPLYLALCSEDEDRLMIDLFRGYNSLVQPIANANSTPLLLRFGLQLILLINLDEKNQIMHTNVWLTLKWYDFQMRWNPVNYGEIRQIRVATDKVWLPDIVLFNNADGNYEVSYHSNVVIDHDGKMLWVPPAIYKSSCIIDVEYFPFDEQVCTLLFGSWTYNEREIILSFNDGVEGVDLQDYSFSSIWDIIEAPAVLTRQKSRIEFRIRVRRKSLFYTVVLIIPTVLMAFLSMMVFYLPACAGEKITLTINVLLSLVVFLLLVSKILPPTSSTIPLMAKYLLLTFLLNIITILVTVIIINVFFRGPTTHRMPQWVRHTFLDFLPKMLMMKRPKRVSKQPYYGCVDTFRRNNASRLNVPQPQPSYLDANESIQAVPQYSVPDHQSSESFAYCQLAGQYPLTREACKAIEAIEYISEHLRTDEEYQSVREDWKYVAMVIDRLLLYIFFGVTLGGTVGVLLSAPNVFEFVDQAQIVSRLSLLYRGET